MRLFAAATVEWLERQFREGRTILWGPRADART